MVNERAAVACPPYFMLWTFVHDTATLLLRYIPTH